MNPKTDHDERDAGIALPIVRRPVAWLFDRLLAAYQAVVSPLLPPACRFSPTCSCYARKALRHHGILNALRLISWRLLRCQPLSAGGFDPVPPGRLTRPAARPQSISSETC
jgi:uncharacterized protein